MRSVLVLVIAAAVVALVVQVVASQSPGAQAGSPCAQSFAAFGGLSGTWNGNFVNHTFSSSGNVTVQAVINDDCTAEATITGIFGQAGPQTVQATYHDDSGGVVVEVVNDPFFGTTTITVAADGTIGIQGDDLHQDIEHISGSGSIVTGHLEVDLLMEFGAGGSATETIELDLATTPTPTATPTPTPTFPPLECPSPNRVAPANTCAPPVFTWGDNNCSPGPPDPVDSLVTLRFDAGLSTDTGDCPDMDQELDSNDVDNGRWGDIDCSGEVNPVDSLKLLRFDAGLEVTQNGECPELGSQIAILSGV
jgi:hypothetical protein